MFENLKVNSHSPAAIRAASLDRWWSIVGKGFTPDPTMDMFEESQGRIDARPHLRAISLNPKPIVMLESKFTNSQYGYVRTYFGEVNVRKTMRLVYSTEAGCDAPLNDPEFSYGDTSKKWDPRQKLVNPVKEGALVLDIGANEGFYSMMSAAYGCRVLSFEPQPLCVALLSQAIAHNNFRHPVKVMNRVVQNKKVEFWAPANSCSGVVQYTDTKEDSKAHTAVEALVKSASIDEAIAANGGSRVILAHMDVEGAEIQVLESGLKSIKEKKIDNLIIEVNSGRWPKYGVTQDHARKILEEVRIGGDYVCRSLANGSGHDVRTFPIIKSWQAQDYRFGGEIDAWCTNNPKFKTVLREGPEAPTIHFKPGTPPTTFNYNS